MLLNTGKENRNHVALLKEMGGLGPYTWTNTFANVCSGTIVDNNGWLSLRQRNYGGGKVHSDAYALCGAVF